MAFDRNQSLSSDALETTADTKLDIDLRGLLNLQQQVHVVKGGKPRNSPSGCVKGLTPSPSKTAGKVGTRLHLERFLSTDQADDASVFLNWKELPQDVHDRMKAQEDKQIVQTSASLAGIQNNLA